MFAGGGGGVVQQQGRLWVLAGFLLHELGGGHG